MVELTAIEMLMLFAASVCLADLLNRKIPNWLVIAGLIVALAGRAWAGGLGAVGSGLGGLLVAAALVVPIYMARGMAAGDVKAIGVAGAFVGLPLAPVATAFVLVMGGLCALAVIARKRVQNPGLDGTLKTKMPYGVAIALGLGSFCWWQLHTPSGGELWMMSA